MSTIIRYKNVSIHQSEQIVLRDVNIEIGEGEFVYLLGRVGSGKSSFMKTMYGELPIASGKAQILDYDIARLKRKQVPYLRRNLGVVFQDFQLLTDRNVEENLLFVLRATGWGRKSKNAMKQHVMDVLNHVGMANKAYKMPYQLSGGEQQRVVIARSLLNTPALILADEPTGNLDHETGKEIMDLLYSISKAGITVVMSTHNILWPEQYPGRKLYFSEGRISEMTDEQQSITAQEVPQQPQPENAPVVDENSKE